MMKVAIYGRAFSEIHRGVYARIMEALRPHPVRLTVYRDLWQQLSGQVDFKQEPGIFGSHDELVKQADLIFSIGGDGTLLNTITLVRDSAIPVLGFNTGRLGFLSSVNREEIEKTVKAVVKGSYDIEKRSLIQLDSDPEISFTEKYALNEVCIHRKDSSSMISIKTYVNDLFLNTYWADGLIVATPTGSTAYSLSCGGPIITPECNNFIITPVSTHTLTVRPMVVPDHCEIRLKAEGRDNHFLLSLDSRSVAIDSSIELKIKKAPFYCHLIRIRGMNFFNTIREKLMWGIDKRN